MEDIKKGFWPVVNVKQFSKNASYSKIIDCQISEVSYLQEPLVVGQTRFNG